MSRPAPLAVPSIPAVERVLPNGLRVILLERPQLPILSATLLFDTGVIDEGDGEAGLAHFTAAMLRQGTERRDAVALAEAIESLGANLGASADYDATTVGVSSLARDHVEVLELLAEVARTPALLEAEVERKRSEILGHLERRKDDLGDRVRVRFSELIYGGHPYRAPRLGYEETVRGLTRERIQRFHTENYRPQRAWLAVAGDLRADDIWPVIERIFGDWTANASAAPHRADALGAPRTGRRLEKIHKDGVTQATIRIGCRALSRESADYVPALVLNYVLGGSGFGSRLMKRLREERGLTYGAYSGFHARKQSGHFLAGLQTSVPTMQAALDELFAETLRMRDHGVTADELAWAQRFFTGSMPLSFQTNDQLATHLLERELYGLEPEFWRRDLERVGAVTPEDLREVAHRYLRIEDLDVVVLADFSDADIVLPA